MAGHRAAILFNGDLYSWGENAYGKLGNGTTKNQYIPVKILENVKEFYGQYNTYAAITTNDDLYCWGRNDCGQVGNGTRDDQYTPVKILENVKEFYLEDHGYVQAAITTNR